MLHCHALRCTVHEVLHNYPSVTMHASRPSVVASVQTLFGVHASGMGTWCYVGWLLSVVVLPLFDTRCELGGDGFLRPSALRQLRWRMPSDDSNPRFTSHLIGLFQNEAMRSDDSNPRFSVISDAWAFPIQCFSHLRTVGFPCL